MSPPFQDRDNFQYEYSNMMFRVDINVPTRGPLAVETKSSFVLMVGTFEQQKDVWKQ